LANGFAGGFVQVEDRDLHALGGQAARGGAPRPDAPPVTTAEMDASSFIAFPQAIDVCGSFNSAKRPRLAVT
jgi:hypothetical protein